MSTEALNHLISNLDVMVAAGNPWAIGLAEYIRNAKIQGWDEGYEAGHSDARVANPGLTTNPYRSESGD